jgi:hypothetical protein
MLKNEGSHFALRSMHKCKYSQRQRKLLGALLRLPALSHREYEIKYPLKYFLLFSLRMQLHRAMENNARKITIYPIYPPIKGRCAAATSTTTTM